MTNAKMKMSWIRVAWKGVPAVRRPVKPINQQTMRCYDNSNYAEKYNSLNLRICFKVYGVLHWFLAWLSHKALCPEGLLMFYLHLHI